MSHCGQLHLGSKRWAITLAAKIVALLGFIFMAPVALGIHKLLNCLNFQNRLGIISFVKLDGPNGMIHYLFI